MTIRHAAVAAALLAVIGGGAAWANDTTASMGAGGLVLERTDGIAMRSEDLFVSAREIRVKYRFFNRTAQDITTVVAFPMPDIPGGSESDLGVSFDDPTEPTPFTTTVDGATAPTQVEQKAMLGGVDYSGELAANGLPVHPYDERMGDALRALSPGVSTRMVAQGLLEDRGYVGDDGTPHPDLVPVWTLKTTHYWTQTFPAGREIGIDHRYTPAVGGTVDSLIGRTDLEGDAEAQAYWASENETYLQKYCTDGDFVAAATRLRARNDATPETWIDYVLVTGANWAEPIGDFRLVVDKGEAANLVSFCETGVSKIGPTQFEVRHSNFTPTRDLSVLILQGARYEQ